MSTSSPSLPQDAVSTASTNTVVPNHVAPTSETNMRAMLRFLVAKGDPLDSVTIVINGKEVEFMRKDDLVSGRAGTIHLVAAGREQELLYWFTEYDGIMTNQNLYVNRCMLSMGDVICGVWETRCNYPFRGLLLCTKASGYTECVFMKCRDFRRVYPGATLDPGAKFDEDLVMRYVCVVVFCVVVICM